MAKSDTTDILKKKFPEFLRNSLGNVSVACEKANIARQTYYAWRSEDKDFDADCQDVLESLMDRVESMIHKKMFVDEDTTMLIFFAKTRMKHRGYIERVETTGKDGEPISQVNYTIEVAKARLKELTGDKNG